MPKAAKHKPNEAVAAHNKTAQFVAKKQQRPVLTRDSATPSDEYKEGSVSASDDNDDDGDDGDDHNDNGSDHDSNIDGDGDAPMTDAPTSSQPSGWRAPTTEEALTIKNSELFKSNAFRLQLDALIPSVRPKPSRIPPLEKFLIDLHAHLTSLKSISPSHPLDAAKRLLKKRVVVHYPDPLPSEDTKWNVSFEPPSDVKVVGSWANKIAVLNKDDEPFGVDIAVQMPSNLFQEKDYLDGRFFHKRAYYLAVLASSISRSSLDVDVQYDFPEHDIRRSVVVINPKQTGSATDFIKLKASIRIIPVLASDCPIPIARLAPSHSNLRPPPTTSSTSTSKTPTPRYNNTLLTSFSPVPTLLSIYNANSSIPSFADTVALLRIWVNQRGFGKGKQTVRGFEALGSWWPFLVSFVVFGEDPRSDGKKKRKSVGKGLSSYQLFRAVLDLLAHHDFCQDPVFMKTIKGEKFSRTDFVDRNRAVFVDPTSTVNLLELVPPSSLELLRHDARNTLRYLDSNTDDPFDDVFMRDWRDMQNRFDVIIRVDVSNAKSRQTVDPITLLDHASESSLTLDLIAFIVREALGTRAKLVALFHSSSSPTSLSSPHLAHPTHISLGIILDSTQATRLVDHGPPLEDEPALQTFRNFWGEKSELRRFKDGRILESVVWDVSGKNPDERYEIPGRIVTFILGRHFGISQDRVTTFQERYNGMVALSPKVLKGITGSPESTLTFRPAQEALDALVKDIKSIENFPLALVTASPITEYLRYTSVFPALPIPPSHFSSLPDSAKYVPPLDIILQFEKSAKWPDDLTAIQKIKLAFFEKLARELMSKSSGYNAHVVLNETGSSAIEDNCALEIIHPTGFAFRASIYHDREHTLLQRIISDRSSTSFAKKEAEAALSLHQRRFIDSPRHHAAIATLQHLHPSFSQTVRLVKRWLSSHFLAPHVPPEIVELICAKVYVEPGPFDPPATGPTGFARVIFLLKEWDWRDKPVVVALYSAASSDDEETSGGEKTMFPVEKRREAEEMFKRAKEMDVEHRRVTWVVCTERDVGGITWSGSSGGARPSWLVAHRIRDVATASWECFETSLVQGDVLIPTMFTHPLDDYDFLIRLKPEVLPRRYQNVTADSTRLGDKTGGSIFGDELRVDFDPAAAFFKDLQRIYDDTMVLFYDPLGGTVIAGLWNPQLQQPRPFKALSRFSSIPVASTKKDDKKPMVVLNEEAILAEVMRMGEGLVQEIVRKGQQ